MNKGTLFNAVNSVLDLNLDYETTKTKYHKLLHKIVNGTKYQWIENLEQAKDEGHDTDFVFAEMQEHAQLDLNEDTIRDHQLFNIYLIEHYGKSFNVEWANEEPKSIKDRTVIFYGDYVYWAK